MAFWYRSNITNAHIVSLALHGLICTRTEAMEWLALSDEEIPYPPEGYVVSLLSLHECSLLSPPLYFLHELLHYYRVEL